MKKSLAVAALCLAFAAVNAAPAIAIDEAPEVDAVVPELPLNVMDEIASRLPLKDRFRVGMSNSEYKKYADATAIAAEYRKQHGHKAASQLHCDGAKNPKIFVELMKNGPKRKAYEHAACYAARKGDVGLLTEMEQQFGDLPTSAAIGAAETGDFETFKRAHPLDNGNSNGIDRVVKEAVKEAAVRGHGEFLRKLKDDLGESFSMHAGAGAKEAASNGNLDLAKSFYDDFPRHAHQRPEIAVEAFQGALEGGHDHHLATYLAAGPFNQFDAKIVYESAAQLGRLDVMAILDASSSRPENVQCALAAAVERGDRDIFDYIRRKHPKWHRNIQRALMNAVQYNRPEFERDMLPHAGQAAFAAAIAGAAATGDVNKVDAYLAKFEARYGHSEDAVKSAAYSAVDAGDERMLQHVLEKLPNLASDFIDYLFLSAALSDEPRMVAKILKSGLNGHQPSNFEDVISELARCGVAGDALLLIVSTHPGLFDQIKSKIQDEPDMYQDALPSAITIAEEEELGDEALQILQDLQFKLDNELDL